ncbi:heterogeneous nuclear ribonucleoprotein A3 homolog 1-like [Athalia rosae]|uniref:heterogeneous nuclear ribonucleoprotein A3 homolog 1-like n=1 Tax=Athalia rosae TaxID=37344 RepID=UPI00203408B5|nr:heterogeneous nuclear ribonucleoprotein A3 homolog 1-like [Athalia rosae]
MARVSPFCIALLVVCGLARTWAQPSDVLESGANPASVALAVETPEENASVARDQRSPQFGFDNYDYSDGRGAGPRRFPNRRKHKPFGHGCRKHHGCVGSHNKPGYGGGHGGSAASASAGSSGGGNYGESSSYAEATSIGFGPITISQAQAHSQSSNGGGRYGDYGGYGRYQRFYR